MQLLQRPLTSFALLLAAACAHAQQTAFYSESFLGGYRAAVRYEQAKGIFHYMIPCKQIAAPGSLVTEAALCWPVSAMRLRMVDGKLDHSDVVRGILTVSATQVRFIPDAPKDLQFCNSIPITKVRLEDDPAKLTRYLTSKEIGYKFGFINYCDDCNQSATALDPSKGAQLAAEFQDVADSLTHFDLVYNRFVEMARQVRFIVAPRNQPTLADPHEAMGLYGTLNRSLAAACSASERSCLEQYANYQDCQSTASPSGCTAPPTCAATCVLPGETLKSLHATECWGAPSPSATLIPSWTEVWKKQDTGAASAHPANGPVGIVGMDGPAGGILGGGWVPSAGWGNLAAIGASMPTMMVGFTTTHPEESCNVAQTYAQLKAGHAR